MVQSDRHPKTSTRTRYARMRHFGEATTADARELRHLWDENRKLKEMVADLALDRQILEDALGTKWER